MNGPERSVGRNSRLLVHESCEYPIILLKLRDFEDCHLMADCRRRHIQGAYRSWKVMENKPNGCRISDPHTCFQKFWTPHFSVLNYTLFRFDSTFWLDSTLRLICVHKVIDLADVYENLTCSISTRLNSSGKTWKMDISGPGKSLKTHVKRSWKVTENHFHCSILAVRIGRNETDSQGWAR